MASKLTSSLKADLPALAELLRSKGRGKDTMLAHITPKEAALLKRRGGSGSVNPETGLPEFEDSGDYDFSAPADVSPTYDVVNSGGGFTPTQADTGVPIEVGPTYFPGGEDYAPVYENVPTYLNYTAPAATTAPYDPMQASQEGFTYGGSMGQTLPTGGIYGQDYASVYAPITYSPADLQRISEGESPEQQFEKLSDEDKKKVEEESKKTGKSWWDTLAALAAAGLIGTALANRQNKAGTQATQQTEQAKQQIQTIAQPYQVRGSNLMRAAEQGQLSAANQQVVNAARAQAAQNIKRRGGVGVLQYANSIADLTDRLLQSQFNQGLAVSQIGDNYALQAINTGLSGNQAVNQANSQFYTQLAQMLAPTILTAAGGTSPTAAQRPTGITP